MEVGEGRGGGEGGGIRKGKRTRERLRDRGRKGILHKEIRRKVVENRELGREGLDK